MSFTDKLASKIFKLIKADNALQRKLVGFTGAMGACGPGADEMFALWKKEHNKPNATTEEFLDWFKEAVTK